jgi:hypothetical protein
MGDDPMDWLADYEAAPGSNIDTTGFRSVDYFMIFFPQEAVDLIVRETNRYARNFIENDQLKENAIMKKWKETTQDEMIKVFLALQIGMGMDQRAQEMDHWRKFWLTSNKFSDIMSRKRYKQLKMCLHFVDNSEKIAKRTSSVQPLIQNSTTSGYCRA